MKHTHTLGSFFPQCSRRMDWKQKEVKHRPLNHFLFVTGAFQPTRFWSVIVKEFLLFTFSIINHIFIFISFVRLCVCDDATDYNPPPPRLRGQVSPWQQVVSGGGRLTLGKTCRPHMKITIIHDQVARRKEQETKSLCSFESLQLWARGSEQAQTCLACLTWRTSVPQYKLIMDRSSCWMWAETQIKIFPMMRKVFSFPSVCLHVMSLTNCSLRPPVWKSDTWLIYLQLWNVQKMNPLELLRGVTVFISLCCVDLSLVTSSNLQLTHTDKAPLK